MATAARTLIWLEGRQLRWVLPIALFTAASAAIFTRAFTLENSSLGPNVCGYIWHQGEPVLLPIEFASSWFGQLGALILPSIAAWLGSRVRANETFLALAPMSSLQVLTARLFSGLLIITFATLITSSILATAGLQPVSWWLHKDLWLVFLGASGLLWLRSVMILLTTALFRQWLRPVPSFILGLVLNFGTLTLWTGLARRLAGRSSGTEFYDPFLIHLQAAYKLQAFSPGFNSNYDCQIMQDFFKHTAPTALSRFSNAGTMLGFSVALVVILCLSSKMIKLKRD